MAISPRFLGSFLPIVLATGLILAACSSDSDDAPKTSGQGNDEHGGSGTAGSKSIGGTGGSAGAPTDSEVEAGSPAAPSDGGADGMEPETRGGAPSTEPEPSVGGSGGAGEDPEPSEPSPGFMRGKELVELNGCVTCHQVDFGGFTVFPNISPDAVTGIGKWTDGEIAAAIRNGLDADGSKMCAMMTRFSFDDAQMADVIEFLRGIPAVSRKITSQCPGHGG